MQCILVSRLNLTATSLFYPTVRTDRTSSWASHLDVGLWRNVGLGIRPQYKQLNLNAFNRVIVPRVWALRVRYLWLIEPVANPPIPSHPLIHYPLVAWGNP